MPFCASCGSAVDGQFCPRCGKPVGAPQASTPPPPPQAQFGQSAPPAAPAAAGLTDNVAGLLCYVLGFITGILFLVLAPYNQNKFIRFHAFQSIFLSGAWIAVFIVERIIDAALLAISWSLLSLFAVLWMLIGFGFLILWIVLMVKAYQGQRWKLPIIGDLAEKQA